MLDNCFFLNAIENLLAQASCFGLDFLVMIWLFRIEQQISIILCMLLIKLSGIIEIIQKYVIACKLFAYRLS